MPRKNIPKGQHILPKTFLNGFVDDKNLIHMLDKENKHIKCTQPLNVAKKRHVYTVWKYNGPSYALEDALGKTDAAIAPLLEKIRTSGYEDLEEKDYQNLINFLVSTVNRTSIAVQAARDAICAPNTLELARKEGEEGEKYIKAITEQKGLLFALTFNGHCEYRYNSFVENFDAYLSTTAPGSPSLVVGDSFLYLESRTTPPTFPQGIGLGQMDVFLHFPISKQHCISLFPKEDRERIGTKKMIFMRSKIPAENVAFINRHAINQAQRFAYSADDYSFNTYLSSDSQKSD